MSPGAPTDLVGRRALVTGAARNIGRATAERLAAAGARVIASDRDVDELEAAFRDEEVDLLPLDLAGDPSALTTAVLERFGPPELIVNNVGIHTRHRFRELGEKDFDLVFRTNLRGPWFLTKGLVEALVESRRRANIVFISSLHARRIFKFPHYSASKAAIVMLVRELAYELAEFGIRVNSVSPGSVPPGGRVRRRDARRIPLGRAGTPEDVANMVMVLLSDELSAYVTGVDVPVDGGLELYDWLTA